MEQKQENQDNQTTEQAVKVTDYKVEFIPHVLHVNQMRVQSQIAQVTLLALMTVSAALKEIDPEHESLKKAQSIMAQGLPLLPESLRIDAAIDQARKIGNKTLYGSEEVND